MYKYNKKYKVLAQVNTYRNEYFSRWLGVNTDLFIHVIYTDVHMHRDIHIHLHGKKSVAILITSTFYECKHFCLSLPQFNNYHWSCLLSLSCIIHIAVCCREQRRTMQTPTNSTLYWQKKLSPIQISQRVSGISF